GAEADHALRAQPETVVVPVLRIDVEERRRTLQLDHDLRGGDRKRLPDPDEDRYPTPAPVVDVEAQRGEGLDLGVGRDARLLAVAAELTSNHVGRSEGSHRLEQLGAL